MRLNANRIAPFWCICGILLTSYLPYVGFDEICLVPFPCSGDERSGLASTYWFYMGHIRFHSSPDCGVLVEVQLADNNRADLARYRRAALIGPSRDQMGRVGHLLSIHKNLRLLFPHHREVAYAWMSTRNRAFDNLAPIELVRQWGFAGLLQVRAYLDRARGA